jgi:uncharacterized cupin superfamily protein
VTRRHPNVVNADELEWWAPPVPAPKPFAGEGKRLGAAAGARHLGASLYRVPAGATRFPAHAHHANEEAILLLEGRGTLRLGDDRVAVRPMDWIVMPVGHVHQLVADQGEDLLYVCVSTEREPEIVTYPDSDKVMAVAGEWMKPTFRGIFRAADGSVGYFDGEGEG